MKKKNLKNSPPEKAPRAQDQQREAPVKSSRYADLFGLAGIALLGIIIYSNSFNGSFHLDDYNNIVDNSAIRNLSEVNSWWNMNTSRPVAFFTFALNYHFNQLDVWSWHLVNVGIHIITAFLVYWLSFLIFSAPVLKDTPIARHKKALALITALLFVSHPLATQSVTYIVQRMASMAAMFYLLSLSLYGKARLSDSSKTSKYLLYLGSFVAALLAMLTKENAFTLPFAIVLLEICFFQSKKISINFKDFRILVSLAATLAVIIFLWSKYSFSIFNPLPPDSANDFRTVTSANYLFTQFSVIVKYIGLLFLPINQNFDYDFQLSNGFFEIRTLLSFALLLSLFILGIFLFNKYRIISFGIFWFFITLSIESSIIPISDLIFEHRTYLPSFGFFLVLTSSIYFLFWNNYKNVALSIFFIIIGSNSFLAFQRNKVWKDEFTLWSDVISKSPEKHRGYICRGVYFKREGKYDQAISDFNKGIELEPRITLGYNNRGIVFTIKKQYDLALIDLNKAIELDPKYAEAYYNRGVALIGKEKFEEAFSSFSKAIEFRPTYAKAYNNRGNIFFKQKKYEEALNEYNKAIEFQPNFAEAFNNRGGVHVNLQQLDKALEDYAKAIEIDPKYTAAYANRDIALKLQSAKKKE